MQGGNRIDSDNPISLQRLSTAHADCLFQLINSNRLYLKEWLPWLDSVREPSDTRAFIEGTRAQYDSGRGPQYAIFCGNELCGVAGFHDLDTDARKGAIGYWLAKSCTGQGIMTEAVQRILRKGFDAYDLTTIEIHCAVENLPSRKVAERVGGRVDRTVSNAEWLYDHYVDHAVYVVEPNTRS